MKYKLEKILWTDAQATQAGWTHIEDVDKSKLPITQSVGFVIHEDEQQVIIYQTLSNNYCTEGIRIPKGMIKKRIKL